MVTDAAAYLLLLFGGGGGYRTYHHGYRDPFGGIAWILLVVVLVWAVAGGGF
jgi:hypothetical protein